MGVMVGQFTQNRFRFRNDDGSETTATWKAAEDTNITHGTTIFRLRIKVSETSASSKLLASTLDYSLNSGAYTPITEGSSVVRFVDSANVADDDPTTEQLTTENSFVAGLINENDDSLGVLLNLESTEFEYVLQVQDADTSNGDTIDFRIPNLDVYVVTPRLTVGANSYTLSMGQGTFTLSGQNVILTYNSLAMAGINYSFGINSAKNSLCS